MQVQGYLYAIVAGEILPVVGQFVQGTNNATALTYVSPAATGANGSFTLNAPAGLYTLATSPTGIAPWTATGDIFFYIGPDDSTLIHTSGNETLAGVKTFSSAPIVPAGSFPISAITPAVPADSAVVHNTGAETIAGVKTFSSPIVVPAGSITDAELASIFLKAGGPLAGYVAASETSASMAYTDLATVGPSVTLATGAQVRVDIYAYHANGTINNATRTGFAVSGATTIAATDTMGLKIVSYQVGVEGSGGASFLVPVTPGVNTFTLKYRVEGGTGTWHDRRIAVSPA
jgi:hypothetical protein